MSWIAIILVKNELNNIFSHAIYSPQAVSKILDISCTVNEWVIGVNKIGWSSWFNHTQSCNLIMIPLVLYLSFLRETNKILLSKNYQFCSTTALPEYFSFQLFWIILNLIILHLFKLGIVFQVMESSSAQWKTFITLKVREICITVWRNL